MRRRQITGHGGVPLSVLSAGDPSNPAIVLIHGWSQAALCWHHQFDALADDFHLIAPDLRGHGASGKPEGDEHYHTSEPWAGDIAAVIEAFGLDRPMLVGWSMGGYVVQDYIAVHGDAALAGVVLIGTGVTKGEFLPQAARDARGADTAVTAADMLSEDMGANIAATVEFLKACTAKPVDADELATMAAFNMACPPAVRRACRLRPGDYRDAMGKLSVPALVMWGDRERLSHRSMFDEMMAVIPGAQARICHGLGHAPFLEDPAQFNADLADFNHRLQGLAKVRWNSDGIPMEFRSPETPRKGAEA